MKRIKLIYDPTDPWVIEELKNYEEEQKEYKEEKKWEKIWKKLGV